jgi:deoxyribodipyrimidine photolyase-related protein
VLGDRLNHDSSAFDGFDTTPDRVLMIEAPGEASHVCSHRARVALFLSAMRHFAAELKACERPPIYLRLDSPLPPGLEQRLDGPARQAIHRDTRQLVERLDQV